MIMKAQLISKKQHTGPVLILCLAICLFCGVGATRLTPATAHQNGLDHNKVATAGPNPGGNSFHLVDENKSKLRVRDDQKGVATSGPNPGGNSFNLNDQNKLTSGQVMEKDVAPSGPNPGGNSVQLLGDHKNVEGAEPKPENSVNVFNRFPKGSVPPSGPSHKGYAETASQERLSGPSPGVGNKYVNNIGHTNTENKPMIIANRLDSGPSTGVGHWSTNGPLNEGKHNPKDIKPNRDVVSFHKLPSGPSPGAGHKYVNGYIEEIEKAQRHNYNHKVNAGNGIQRRKTMGCDEEEEGSDLYADSIYTRRPLFGVAPPF
eukprot:Gb_15970 [translate_table: standard]